MEEQASFGFTHEEMVRPPRTDWVPPSELPDRLHGPVGFDLETEDRGIQAGKGAGWAWHGGGKVVGYSVTADNFRGYLPIAHGGGGNMDPDLVRRWLNGVLADESQAKIAANAQYDVGWARRDGVEIRGPIYDVQWAEALLDEHRWGYALEGLGKTYLGAGKDEDLLKEAARAYGVDPKGGLWKLPAPLVGPYAEADSSMVRDIWAQQEKKLRADDLWEIFELESALLPMYVDMRWRGIRVDLDRAQQLKDQWRADVSSLLAEIRSKTGISVDLWTPTSLAKAFDHEGVPYGRTEKTGAPSISKELLTRTDHWLCRAILTAREKDKLASTFVDGHILGHSHAGRVHAEFHPLRGEGGGTIGGRGSMSNPNVQQIPSRTEEGRKLRSCFLPEEGETWYAADFSQQEPRLTVHFAYQTKINGERLRGAAEARARYQDDPDMDYHDFVAQMTGLPRKQAKTLNLALIYGRGAASTAEELGRPLDEAKTLIAQHQEGMPFAPALAAAVQERVADRGEIRTLLGRKCRFPLWEPASWKASRGTQPAPLWKAKKQWPGQRLRRAWLHKSLNRLIQGSAADQTKKAMLGVWQAGLGGHVLIQVHDELCLSAADPAVASRVAEIMRDCVRLEVPSKVDVESGPNWGDAH